MTPLVWLTPGVWCLSNNSELPCKHARTSWPHKKHKSLYRVEWLACATRSAMAPQFSSQFFHESFWVRFESFRVCFDSFFPTPYTGKLKTRASPIFWTCPLASKSGKFPKARAPFPSNTPPNPQTPHRSNPPPKTSPPQTIEGTKPQSTKTTCLRGIGGWGVGGRQGREPEQTTTNYHGETAKIGWVHFESLWVRFESIWVRLKNPLPQFPCCPTIRGAKVLCVVDVQWNANG